MTTLVLSGKSGAGKDMFAQFLKEELEKHNKKVIIMHYADALKWLLKEFYKWDGNKDEYGRHMLQYIGTDVVRHTDPDYWVDIVARFLKAIEDTNDFDVAIVPDARFENEVNNTLNLLTPSYCVRIERKNADGTMWINPTLTEKQRTHASEISLDNYSFDYVIHNDEGLGLLKESATTLLEDLHII